MTTTIQRIFTILMILMLLWIIIATTMYLFFYEFFFYVETPAPVVVLPEDQVLVEINRYARFPMQGVCQHQLACEFQMYDLGVGPCPLEAGFSFWLLRVPLPEDAKGNCQFRGVVNVAPFGNFGPLITYSWESESFQLPEG